MWSALGTVVGAGIGIATGGAGFLAAGALGASIGGAAGGIGSALTNE